MRILYILYYIVLSICDVLDSTYDTQPFTEQLHLRNGCDFMRATGSRLRDAEHRLSFYCYCCFVNLRFNRNEIKVYLFVFGQHTSRTL